MGVNVLECANCGRKIGKLETPRVFNEQPVCAGCWKALSEQEDVAPDDLVAAIGKEALAYESKQDTKQRMARGAVPATPLGVTQITRFCPTCGTNAPPVKKAKGSIVVLVILLLLWVLPGLLYMVFYHGHAWYCSNCGAKLADAN